MNSAANALLGEIESYCRSSGIAESTFGKLVVNDGKLCTRLREGKNVTLDTADRIKSYIHEHQPGQPSGPGENAVRSVEGDEAMTVKKAKQDHKTAKRRSATQPVAATGQQVASPASADDRPFRFYDNRQKYLAFVNTTNEKRKVAERASRELAHLKPTPPALRVFDAGMGDGTVLTHLMRSMHRRFPITPFFIVGKEISLEDVRLSLEKLPDRFMEHPASVIVITNLYYAEAPWLRPRSVRSAAALNWREVALDGDTAAEYGEQLAGLDPFLLDGWQVRSSEKTGNPVYVRPSVLVIYRRDHSFLLDSVIPRPGQVDGNYDLAIASQPWRARMSAEFKVKKVLAPIVRSLAPAGRLLVVQSCGNDPALELVQKVWPEEEPFRVNRQDLIRVLREELGRDARNYNFVSGSDAKAVFRYEMHTLPSEVQQSIGTSTLFAAWNASIYVNQIEDERLEPAIMGGDYLRYTAEVLQKHKGLWFNDESFVVSRKR
ncbi:hypothetical protein [Candidatus Rariloculus sp.]|uniref:hypothetical protein n=1 Tax=Candidatus Rariloculus sp. TaxID=3101265 RepID=UPI003D0DBAA8